jgi:ABC-type transporter MlaC component
MRTNFIGPGSFCRRVSCAIAAMICLAQAAAASEVTAPIEQLDAGLLQAMKAGKGAPFQQRYDLLGPLVVRAVDLDAILQTGVGAGWASVPAAQQAALKIAFQHYSIATYVSHFDEFDCGGWKAIDVTADSEVSQVVAQQEEIHSLFRSGGGAGLLARLQQKTAELSGGAVR